MPSRAMTKGFRSAVFYLAVKETVHKRVPKPLTVDVVYTRLVDAISFTISVAEFVKHEVEKKFLEKIKTEKRFVKQAKAVEKKRSKGRKGNSEKKNRLGSAPKPPNKQIRQQENEPEGVKYSDVFRKVFYVRRLYLKTGEEE